MTLLFVFYGAIVFLTYCVIAFLIAGLSEDVWREGESSFVAFLLFPFSAMSDIVGINSLTLIDAYGRYSIGFYLFATCITWPLRVIWSIVTTPLWLPVLLISRRKVNKESEVHGRVSSRALKQERIAQLEDERRRIAAEVESLEFEIAREDAGRQYRLPGRLN